MVNPTDPPNSERRQFLKKACSVCIGTGLVIVPAAAGIAVLLDPLQRKSLSVDKMKITTLDSLPQDGTPVKFSIFASRQDAWNKFPDAPIGAIYLRRTGDKSVEALNVVCPHAGCFVDFRSEKRDFYCPCHNSSFAIDGKISTPGSPAPRGLDSLEVEIRNNQEVWVQFQNFLTGKSEKVPVA